METIEFNALKLGQCFQYPDKPKRTFRVVNASWMGIQFEDIKKEFSLWDYSYKNTSRWYDPVVIVPTVYKLEKMQREVKWTLPKGEWNDGYEPYLFGGGLAYIYWADRSTFMRRTEWQGHIHDFANSHYNNLTDQSWDYVCIKEGVHTFHWRNNPEITVKITDANSRHFRPEPK